MAKIVVVQGPTAAGKSAVAVKIASEVGCVVISADSRQFYSEMAIGTAVPTSEELSAARHYFIQHRSVTEHLSAGGFAEAASVLINELSEGRGEDEIVAVVVGGSGLYVDALLYGLDPLPSDEAVRAELSQRVNVEGLESLLSELKRYDSVTFETIEKSNPQRVIRALEVCKIAGKPYSELKSGASKMRFDAVKIIVDMPREKLYERIDKRVDVMMAEGLEAEAMSVYKYRELSALRTVGYSELFEYFDGKITLQRAVELIKQHSRNYAKRQVTWLRRDSVTPRFEPSEIARILEYIRDGI